MLPNHFPCCLELWM